VSEHLIVPSRRLFLGSVALGLGGVAVGTARGAFADMLSRTPRLTEGPFYPPKLPLDTDNDLLIVNDSITQAVGEVTHLSGRVLSAAGEPILNAVVEIWQCDAKGVYLAQGNRGRADANFQGFGRFVTGTSGEYYFRTIKPVPYPGRTPHIHFKIKKGGKELLTTQLFIKGHPQNDRDGIFRGARDTKLVEAEFKPLKESMVGELTARFDLVLGATPDEGGDRPRRGPGGPDGPRRPPPPPDR
jgi:protocatechuate 3,4-dioxygenase beta subunit